MVSNSNGISEHKEVGYGVAEPTGQRQIRYDRS